MSVDCVNVNDEQDFDVSRKPPSMRKFLNTPRLYLMAVAAIFQFLAWVMGLTRPVPYAAGVCVGFLAVITGMAIRAGVTIYMERRKAWGLLTTGPFAVCRHPRYVGTVTVMGGLILAMGCAPFGLWLVPLLLTIIPHRVHPPRGESASCEKVPDGLLRVPSFDLEYPRAREARFIDVAVLSTSAGIAGLADPRRRISGRPALRRLRIRAGRRDTVRSSGVNAAGVGAVCR